MQPVPEHPGATDLLFGRNDLLHLQAGHPAQLARDGPEDSVAGMIVAWYQAHRRQGGQPDPVAEDLIGEVRTEEAAGQAVSHAPGQA
ncbi:hypothetical protein D9M69_463960 [compost metagenome]